MDKKGISYLQHQMFLHDPDCVYSKVIIILMRLKNLDFFKEANKQWMLLPSMDPSKLEERFLDMNIHVYKLQCRAENMHGNSNQYTILLWISSNPINDVFHHSHPFSHPS